MPAWASNLLDRLGLANPGAVKERFSAALTAGSSFFATQALDIGWSTASFIVSLLVMLYLLFFFVRDGDTLAKRITDAIPLPADQQLALIGRSTAVIREMVKGNLLVATVQGALGGLIFWFLGIHAPVLWASVMTLLSFAASGGLRAHLAPSRHIFASDRCRLAGRDSAGLWHLHYGLRGQLAAAAARRERHADAGLPRTDFHARRNRNLRSWRIYCGTGGCGAIRRRVGHIRLRGLVTMGLIDSESRRRTDDFGASISPAYAACVLSEPEAATVAEIIDGETLKLGDGRIVRLIGAKAPAPPLGWRGDDSWPFVEESKQALDKLASGKQVELKFGGRRNDRYDHLLAQVFVMGEGGRSGCKRSLSPKAWPGSIHSPTIALVSRSFSRAKTRRGRSVSAFGAREPIASKAPMISIGSAASPSPINSSKAPSPK